MVSPAAQVMYWWRLTCDNGHTTTLTRDRENIMARAAVASIRLWGEMWAQADSVNIHLLAPVR